jgi:hypothetical protein
MYSLPEAAFVSGTVISSTAVNSDLSDIANALTASIAKDGQTVPTANLPMGTYAHTGVGNASARTMYAAAGQVQDSSLTWCGTAGGTADALTLTPTPAISAYATGQRFQFKASSSANTGAATVAVSGLTAKAIQLNDTALAAGDIVANKYYEIIYDGTAFQLTRVSGTGGAPASETVAGIIEIATAAETTTGTDDTRAITPKKLTEFAPATATFVSAADEIIFRDATDSKLKRGALSVSQVIVQRAYVQYTTRATPSSVIPNDGTIPQISEGTEILSVSITPQSVTNRIRATVVVPAYVDGLNAAAALFIAGTNDALAVSHRFVTASGSPAVATDFTIVFEHVPGSTSAQTYSVRVGPASGTLYINGNTSTQPYGAKQISALVLEEIYAT